MASRILVTVLGTWLIVVPEILDQAFVPSRWWFVDLAIGMAVILSAWLPAAWMRRRYAGLMLVLGGALIAAAYVDFAEPTVAAQNRAMVGLLIMMSGLIRSGDAFICSPDDPLMDASPPEAPAGHKSPLCRSDLKRAAFSRGRISGQPSSRCKPGSEDWKCWFNSRL